MIFEEEVTVDGQVRSYNKLVDGVRRHYVCLFVKTIKPSEGCHCQNDVAIVGTICKPPAYRVTPFGREICDLMVAVNRGFGKCDYIPCIVWGRNALWTMHMVPGVVVSLYGRLQEREFQKLMDNGEYVTRTTYELSVANIERFVQVKEARA